MDPEVGPEVRAPRPLSSTASSCSRGSTRTTRKQSAQTWETASTGSFVYSIFFWGKQNGKYSANCRCLAGEPIDGVGPGGRIADVRGDGRGGAAAVEPGRYAPGSSVPQGQPHQPPPQGQPPPPPPPPPRQTSAKRKGRGPEGEEEAEMRPKKRKQKKNKEKIGKGGGGKKKVISYPINASRCKRYKMIRFPEQETPKGEEEGEEGRKRRRRRRGRGTRG